MLTLTCFCLCIEDGSQCCLWLYPIALSKGKSTAITGSLRAPQSCLTPGMFISLCMVKWILTFISRAILHDEKVFVNPSAFDPLRFLEGDKNLPDPHIVFGYGRRFVTLLSPSCIFHSYAVPKQIVRGERHGSGHILACGGIHLGGVRHSQV